MSSSESDCFFSLPQSERIYRMTDRINTAPFPDGANAEAAVSASEGIKLCGRETCSLNVATFVRIASTQIHSPELIPTIDAELGMQLPPDCARYQPQPDQQQ